MIPATVIPAAVIPAEVIPAEVIEAGRKPFAVQGESDTVTPLDERTVRTAQAGAAPTITATVATDWAPASESADLVDGPWALDPEANPPPLITVPVEKVRFLQAMAEDGPGARPCRVGGFPLQRIIQRTTC